MNIKILKYLSLSIMTTYIILFVSCSVFYPERMLGIEGFDQIAASSQSGAAGGKAKIDTTKPSTPTNLKALNITKTSADITWSSSTDASGISKYNIYRDNKYIFLSTTTLFSDLSLQASTSYSYIITAVDSSINKNVSASSSILKFSTLPNIFLATSVPSLYVSPSGNDINDGSFSKPLATISKAVSLAKPGYSIFLRGGIYYQIENVKGNGALNNPIVVKPYPNELVVFDASFQSLTPSTSVINISNSSYINLEGLEVKNSSGRGVSSYESNNIIFKNLKIHDIKYRGLGGSGYDLVFEGNEIYNACLSNINQSFGAGDWPGALAVTYFWSSGKESERITINSNRIHDNWGEGIIVGHTKGSVVSNNIMENNFSVNIYTNHSNDVEIKNNVVSISNDLYNRNDRTPARSSCIALASEPPATSTLPTVQNINIYGNNLTGCGRGISYYQYTTIIDPENTYRNISIHDNTFKNIIEDNLKFIDVLDGYNQPSGNLLFNNILYKAGSGRYYSLADLSSWLIYNNTQY